MADSRQEIPLSLRHTPAVLFQDGACRLCPRLCGLWHRSLDSSPARAADDTTLYHANGAHWRCTTWRYPAARSAWGSCSLQPHSSDTARPSCCSRGQKWRHREGNPSSSREGLLPLWAHLLPMPSASIYLCTGAHLYSPPTPTLGARDGKDRWLWNLSSYLD